MAAAIWAKATSHSSWRPRQISGRCGHVRKVASCLCHSGGIQKVRIGLALVAAAPTARQVLVGVDSAVSEEGPPVTGVTGTVTVAADDEVRRAFTSRICEELPLGSAGEAVSPKAEFSFAADAVDGGDVDAVRDGVASLNSLPSVALHGVLLGAFFVDGADGGGVDQDFGAFHRGEACRFGVPLVPADQDADLRVLGFEDFVSAVSGGEVELLEVERVVRDVRFTVRAHVGAVGVQHGGGVEVETGCGFFIEGGDDDDLELAREFG